MFKTFDLSKMEKKIEAFLILKMFYLLIMQE